MSSKSNMLVSLVIIAIIFGGVGAMIFVAAPYDPPEIAIVMMAPGFGDMSKADNIQEGMDEISGDIVVRYYIPSTLPTTVTQAREIIESLVRTNDYDLIIGVGADMAPAVQTAATNYPLQKFGMIGANVALDNVASSTFATEQSGFLAGVVAAFLANDQPYFGHEPFDGEIGILAAQENDVELLPMINGFIQGVEAANETYNLNVTITEIDYINSWNNTLVAQTKTASMFAGGISVIFAPVRASILGVRLGMLQAANSFSFAENAAGRMPLVIAAEGNQDYFGCTNPDIPVAPSWIATSAIARTDLALY
ncbi:MAG: BMP family ABC transporter substrate-binding protein, partial [Candidatus Thorarchaeota archaeon]|nr:BMP family ABC transporter substrate-binding protein [Candidatus Thorarchaeota archaeon]